MGFGTFAKKVRVQGSSGKGRKVSVQYKTRKVKMPTAPRRYRAPRA